MIAGTQEWISGIDTVNLRRLQHHLGAHFSASKRRGRIRREEGVTGTGSENHDTVLIEITQRLAADVRLDNLLEVQRGLDTDRNARLCQRVLERHRIHHGGEHAHVVTGRTVHAVRTQSNAAENIAAAHYDAHLHPNIENRLDLANHVVQRIAVDTELVVPHEGFSGKLQ